MTDITTILQTIPLTPNENLGKERILSLKETAQWIDMTIDVSNLSPAMRQKLKHNIEGKFKAHGITKPIRLILTAEKNKPTEQASSSPSFRPPDVKSVIAIASGKGGVGKSTLAVALAIALTQEGQKVGLMDSDIYGPSLPTMLGVPSSLPPQNDKGLIVPPMRHGIKMMSVGLLLDKETPLIWRGPMVMSAMNTMLTKVDWGKLDILLVDLPPGTGDATLTLAQRATPDGVIIISTPQEIALLDARKALQAFVRLNVTIIGIVENMSSFTCPHCGEQTSIFSHDGAQNEAQRQSCPFLGSLPLDPQICEGGEQGRPLIVSEPDGDHAQRVRKIATALLAQIDAL